MSEIENDYLDYIRNNIDYIRKKYKEIAGEEKTCGTDIYAMDKVVKAYEKGRADMAKEVCEIVDCETTEECADCVFYDYRDDMGQLVTYCKLKEIADKGEVG